MDHHGYKSGSGWNPIRCFRLPASHHTRNAIGGAPGISEPARVMLTDAFQSLTEPTPRDGSPIVWAIADCTVNGRWSMAILALIAERAHPVFVVPPPGTRLRNWCGDALEVRSDAWKRSATGRALEHELDLPSILARMRPRT